MRRAKLLFGLPLVLACIWPGGVSASASSHFRFAPSRITRRFFVSTAVDRTLRLEASNNSQRVVAKAPRPISSRLFSRHSLRRPIVLSQHPSVYVSPTQGRIGAYVVSVLGTTLFGDVPISSVYEYTFARGSGALLKYEVTLARPDLLRVHGFPANPHGANAHQRGA